MCLGVPAQIVKLVDEDNKLAMVDLAGVSRQVNIACIVDENHTLESCVGSWVLVHVGFAMSIINEEEARKTLQLLAEVGEVQEAINDIQTGAK